MTHPSNSRLARKQQELSFGHFLRTYDLAWMRINYTEGNAETMVDTCGMHEIGTQVWYIGNYGAV
jgi:hypothetical protein